MLNRQETDEEKNTARASSIWWLQTGYRVQPAASTGGERGLSKATCSHGAGSSTSHLLLVIVPPGSCCSFSHTGVLIGQFGVGKFKLLLNNTLLNIHSSTSAVQTSSWLCFLNLVYYTLKWDARCFVFIGTWHSPCWCSSEVQALWVLFFFLGSHTPYTDAYKLKISLTIFLGWTTYVFRTVNLFSPWLWF